MYTTVRHWLYRALEEQKGGKLARWLNGSLMFLIAANVAVVMAESENGIHQQYKTAFTFFETFSVLIFTLEYVTRIWCSVEFPEAVSRSAVRQRIRYMLKPMALVDLLAILPFYMGFFLGVDDLLMLRSLRLLRILKLTRYSHSMELLISVLKQEAETMVSALFMLCILILLAATGIYLVEGHQQPEAFGSIPRSLWWSIVTLTTVGYGDVVPHTAAGKVFSGVITITGIAVAALPAAILASGLINELKRRRELFRAELRRALDDGMLDFTGLRYLERMRVQIGVSRADARLLFEGLKHESRLYTHLNCPHCDQPLVIKHPAGHIQVEMPVQKT